MPEVDADAVTVADDELLAAASAVEEDELDDDVVIVDNEDDDDDSDEDDEDDDLEEDDDEDYDEIDEDDFWVSVGIDPIQIITAEGEFYSLRCYLGDDPVFLGKNGKIFAFNSKRALERYLADDNEHDLSPIGTFEDIQVAATDGSLEIDVYEDNVYVLPGLTDDIIDGPRRIDRKQLELAVELLTDAADYADDDTVADALGSTTPLGWFVDYTLNPDPKRMAPSPPFDNEPDAWRALEHDFDARLEKKRG